MDIVEFLTDRWYLLVILLAFLSSLFRNKQRKNEKGSRRMPPFSGQPATGPVFKRHDDSGESAGAAGSSQPIEEDRIPARMFTEERTASPMKSAELGSRKPAELARETVQMNNHRKTMDRRQQVAANRLVQGIIWSEVLGPPRAHKPYRRSRRQPD